MDSKRLEQIISWVIKLGLAALTILPLYVSSSMLFPFITGKNFMFRIIVEALFALWIGLAFAWPQYRPRLTLLVKLSTIFILIVFLADLFGPNPYRSFFSNYERMEGFMMIFHLWLYFLMLLSVLKTKRDWLIFFHITIATSVLVGFVGVLQKFGFRVSAQGGYRIDATIGNATYLAAYISFHVWLLVLLLRRFWQNWWLKIIYGALLIFELAVIYFTASRGATIGLLVSAFVLFLAAIIYWQRLFGGVAFFRKFAVGILVLIAVGPFILWMVRDTGIIPRDTALSRLVSISLEERTTKSRFLIWKMSLKGIIERPILGWGQENYYLVFQKYFEPKLYASEAWFDRSHNIFIDWLVHTGFLGAGAFFAMLGSVFWLLWKGLKNSRFDTGEGLILGAAFVSYLVQNLFVFDNLNTYLLFFALLAYADYLTAPVTSGATPLKDRFDQKAIGKFWLATALALVVVSGFVYNLHIKPMLASKTLIRALTLRQIGAPLDKITSEFERALSYNTFGNAEIREQLGQMARQLTGSTEWQAGIERFVAGNSSYIPEDQKKFIDLALIELQREIAHPAKDVKHMIFLSAILDRAVHLDPRYAVESEAIAKEAIRLSPRKQILYFELAQLYVFLGRFDDAFEVLRRALAVEPANPAAHVNFLLVGTMAKRTEIVQEVAQFSSKIDFDAIGEIELAKIGLVYISISDYASAKRVYEELLAHSVSADYEATLAALLGELGEYDQAIVHARKSAELKPENFAKESKIFIELMEQKKRGQ